MTALGHLGRLILPLNPGTSPLASSQLSRFFHCFPDRFHPPTHPGSSSPRPTPIPPCFSQISNPTLLNCYYDLLFLFIAYHPPSFPIHRPDPPPLHSNTNAFHLLSSCIYSSLPAITFPLRQLPVSESPDRSTLIDTYTGVAVPTRWSFFCPPRALLSS